MKKIFRVNNFDAIRLIAAFQVAIQHTVYHLKVEQIIPGIFPLLDLFPGVPIFFFVSGFLISKSYENNSIISEYSRNRILRIYPALIFCTFVAVLSVYLSSYFSKTDAGLGEIIIFIFGQISIFQFYNPDFMRAFGTGVLNGSLWTITVELQFYIIIPILYWIFDLAKTNHKNNIKIVLLILFFMLFHIARYHFINEYKENLLFKIWGISFFPWIYMFLVGILFQKNFSIMYRLLSGRFLYVLPVYLVCSYLSVHYLGWNIGNGINPVLYFILAILIFSLAYSSAALSGNIFKGNDISYGIYIYHIPIVNLLIYYGYVANVSYVFMAIIVTTLIAIASWLLIEKPSMKLKKHSLNPG